MAALIQAVCSVFMATLVQAALIIFCLAKSLNNLVVKLQCFGPYTYEFQVHDQPAC